MQNTFVDASVGPLAAQRRLAPFVPGFSRGGAVVGVARNV